MKSKFKKNDDVDDELSEDLSEEEEKKEAKLATGAIEPAEPVLQMSAHDANMKQAKLDRKTTIKQAKTFRERDAAVLENKEQITTS